MGNQNDDFDADLRREWRERRDEISDELERQARETVRLVRENAGELGSRVLDALKYAQNIWMNADPEAPESPPDGLASPTDQERARDLVRRWTRRDFLVDAELPDAMHPLTLEDADIWRVDLRQRGETRTWGEASERYTGGTLPPPAPTKLLWEYDYAPPEIERGVLRERLKETAQLGACLTCQGTGHRTCKDCDGKGFVTCPKCRGKARVTCKRCHGRGRIADATAERRARADKGYFQVHAERLAADATGKLADLSEILRQEYGVPLPPSANWAPTAPASGETVPCPDCRDGTVACTCGDGKLVCETCKGSGYAICTDCDGSGRVIRYREVVRTIDTDVRTQTLPVRAESAAAWLTDEMVRKAAGEQVWEGDAAHLSDTQPVGVPASVWMAARTLAQDAQEAAPAPAAVATAPQDERRVIRRQIRLSRVRTTRLEYLYGTQRYTVVAVGVESSGERFWAETFPPRWSRVGRFFKALINDLNSDHPPRLGSGDSQDDHSHNGHVPPSYIPRVRIVEDTDDEDDEDDDE